MSSLLLEEFCSPAIEDSALGGRGDWTTFQYFPNCDPTGPKLPPHACARERVPTHTSVQVLVWEWCPTARAVGKDGAGNLQRAENTSLSSLQLWLPAECEVPRRCLINVWSMIRPCPMLGPS